ncbi:MAG: ABC transporter permease [Phycisphaerales bacterium]|nr:ABC transporter permease [Phycisphaerales bacterium]
MTTMQLEQASRPAVWLPAVSLCRRELVRFVRQPNRVIGALATPLVFWLLIGGGMGSSFQIKEMAGGQNYIQYFFPGTIVMIMLFTAIFSTISIIEDRREGFLQSVLVAPVSRMAIVLGKVLGGTLLAFAQGAIFLALAPTVGIHLGVTSILLTLAMMFILSFALTGLGFCIAWRMSSTQGFHAIMNLFLLPLWFLSGALFPMDRAWGVLRWVMMLNPVTYGLSAIRRALYWGQPMGNHLPGMGLSLTVSVVFALGMFLAASAIAGGRVSADLQ